MIPFLFAIHSHQPVGNFGWVFERAFKESYQPFLELLADHRHFKIALHYSGCLLEWIEKNRPDHLDLIKKLVDRGQVEILGGGYYEPIFTAIPERDARAQIKTYLDHLEDLFGKRPQGIWLTERVWDPHLPTILHDLGVKYTLVDDSHFRFAGIEPEDVWGPFLTEREGKSLIIFPIDKTLRYNIPFKEPGETIEYIIGRGEKEPNFVACYGDDGEKFGVWPDTHEWVFVKGWLKRFFDAVEDARDEIRTGFFSDYIEYAKPRARVYLPPASYDEMMEWVLPPKMGREFENLEIELKEKGRLEELAPFVRGGHWDMFLAKYHEANRMQKRMLLASERIERAGDAPREAIAALHRSQCNCAYWHGVFGGLYLSYLRHENYKNMIEAETLAGVNESLVIENKDYDLDGHDEIIVSSPGVNAVISPALGGSLVNLEYPEKRFCISNVMSRREETYHTKITEAASAEDGGEPRTIHERVVFKEEGLEKFLVYDRYPRNSLQDHLAPLDMKLEDVEQETMKSMAAFAGRPYEVVSVGDDSVVLARESEHGKLGAFRIEKHIKFERGRAGFIADYRVSSTAQHPLSLRLCVEFNLTLLAGDEKERHYLINDIKVPDPTMLGRGSHPETEKIELVNQPDEFKAVLKTEKPCLLLRYPIQTVSQSESGFERTYQGSCLWITWPLELEPGKQWTAATEFDFENL
jgi:alpha-amylase